MEDLVNLIMNSCVTVVVIAYFMYRDFKFMNRLDTTLQALVDTVGTLKDSVINNIKKGSENDGD